MSEPRKYELTDEVKTVSGPGGRKVTLRRIRGGVPNYVKHALVQAAKHNEKARQFERKIERWLEQHDIHDLDVVRDILIDCTQLENRPDEAIRRLEDVIDSVRQYKAYYKQTGKSRASKVQQASASPKQASASPKQGGRYRDITAEI